MAASDIAARMTCDSTAEIKEHFKHLWDKYLQSIVDDKPVFYLPKDIADQLGNASVEDMARRFGKIYGDHMLIIYDESLEAFCIGPAAHLDFKDGTRVFKHVPLQNHDTSTSTTSEAAELLLQPIQKNAGQMVPAKSAQGSPTKPPKIPKPANSWILYRQSKHAGVVAQNPGMHNSEISIIISKMWQNETAEVKASFKKKAVDEKQRLLQEHPGWKCNPRKSSEIKKRSKVDKLLRNTRSGKEAMDAPIWCGAVSRKHPHNNGSGKKAMDTPIWGNEVPGMTGTPRTYGLNRSEGHERDKNFTDTLPLIDSGRIDRSTGDVIRVNHRAKNSQFDAMLLGFLS